jgi:hypothetical protein
MSLQGYCLLPCRCFGFPGTPHVAVVQPVGAVAQGAGVVALVVALEGAVVELLQPLPMLGSLPERGTIAAPNAAPNRLQRMHRSPCWFPAQEAHSQLLCLAS